MTLAFDDFGRPFLIVKEEEKKRRVSGVDAVKNSISIAKQVADVIKTSFGPKGFDKIIISPDGEIIISNDGSTILKEMPINNQIAQLLMNLSVSQDNEVGDGTTGIVILASALLEGAESLIDKGLHPTLIARGFETACHHAIKHMTTLSEFLKNEDSFEECLVAVAKTSLSSKIVNTSQHLLAQLAVKIILQVLERDTCDVDFDRIKILGKIGDLRQSEVINGIILDKEFSHPQMIKTLHNAKIAILTCPFEPPKPKTKHKLDINTVSEYKLLQEYETSSFHKMIDHLKNAGVNIVVCQWGFDDEANHLLLINGINAIRWVGGGDIELLALATNAKIIPRFEDISPEKLGFITKIQERSISTTGEKILEIEGLSTSKMSSILLFASNKMFLDEVERSVLDALCSLRTIIKSRRIIYGGGSAEISCALIIEELANDTYTMQQHVYKAFASALMSIPSSLALNSGQSPISIISNLKNAQLSSGNSHLGVNCISTGICDMKFHNICDPLDLKIRQLRSATQFVRMILKIDDVIEGQI